MPASQRNFNYSDYESDDGTTYCLKASAEAIAETETGAVSPCTSGIAYGRATKRRAPRFGIYRDPTTFRTVRYPFFTPTDYAAATVGTDTSSVFVPGLATAVIYTLVKKVPERVPSIIIGRQDADHA